MPNLQNSVLTHKLLHLQLVKESMVISNYVIIQFQLLTNILRETPGIRESLASGGLGICYLTLRKVKYSTQASRNLWGTSRFYYVLQCYGFLRSTTACLYLIIIYKLKTAITDLTFNKKLFPLSQYICVTVYGLLFLYWTVDFPRG